MDCSNVTLYPCRKEERPWVTSNNTTKDLYEGCPVSTFPTILQQTCLSIVQWAVITSGLTVTMPFRETKTTRNSRLRDAPWSHTFHHRSRSRKSIWATRWNVLWQSAASHWHRVCTSSGLHCRSRTRLSRHMTSRAAIQKQSITVR